MALILQIDLAEMGAFTYFIGHHISLPDEVALQTSKY